MRYTFTAFNLLHCKRLNAVYVYRYVYEDINQWMETNERCITPFDIKRGVVRGYVHSSTVRYTYTAFNLLHRKRLNAVYVYRYVYEDIYQWMETNERCITPYDT